MSLATKRSAIKPCKPSESPHATAIRRACSSVGVTKHVAVEKKETKETVAVEKNAEYTVIKPAVIPDSQVLALTTACVDCGALFSSVPLFVLCLTVCVFNVLMF